MLQYFCDQKKKNVTTKTKVIVKTNNNIPLYNYVNIITFLNIDVNHFKKKFLNFKIYLINEIYFIFLTLKNCGT